MHNIRHIHVNTSKGTYWPKYTESTYNEQGLMTYLAWQGTHAVLRLSGMVWASEMLPYLKLQQFVTFRQFHTKYSNSEVMIMILLHTTAASLPKEFCSHAVYSHNFFLKIKLFTHSSNAPSSMHETSYDKTFQYETTDY